MQTKRLLTLFGVFLFVGCSSFGISKLDLKYGESAPKNRVVERISKGNIDYWTEVKPIIESRCVVCHACYDAPCQLKLSAIEGIERGATEARVYNPTRLLEAPLTRLFEDAHTTQGWRDKGFYPVLNEYQQTPKANKEASVLHRMLELKQSNPLPEVKVLDDEFKFANDRTHNCPKPGSFDDFAEDYPNWGMPYALPSLAKDEYDTLTGWIEQGATYTARPAIDSELQKAIVAWETFLNGGSKKQQLASRYIYEHLFLGHLFFDEINNNQYFRLVRSKTPSNEPVDLIATRRPYDDPKTDRVYYRIIPELETVVAKTHMPYALNSRRMEFWKSIFIEREYRVDTLPGYDPILSANPFEVFDEIPVTSRYEFLLDEAQFTVMGFIKGPVCRGQSALNVINDHFWVFFAQPVPEYDHQVAQYHRENADILELPSAKGTVLTPLSTWRNYSKKQLTYLEKRDELLKKSLGKTISFDLQRFWDGNGTNSNAALTVFRHFDSATVEKGLLGAPPKTAWLIGYTDLERIHYLLVSGYDVYGNVGHQLLSRLYMDFLRMNSESNFLLFLPSASREKEREYWYRDVDPELYKYLSTPRVESTKEPQIGYKTDNHKLELFELLRQRLKPVLDESRNLHTINDQDKRNAIAKINGMRGAHVQIFPEHAILLLETDSGDEFYTLMRNSAHLNITSMFGEAKRRIPEEDEMMILKGFVGAYPGAFFKVEESKLKEFVSQFTEVQNESDYFKLRDTFGVRRTDPNFWAFSDRVHEGYKKSEPLNYGALDYNRLENR